MDNLNLAGITITKINGYGTVQYGESTDYSTSTIKQVVDVWMNSAVKSGDTATARLITLDELMDNLGYNKAIWETTYYRVNAEYTPRWVYSEIYSYWTMSQYQDSQYLWIEHSYGNLNSDPPSSTHAFRPVLELNKSADITKLAS